MRIAWPTRLWTPQAPDRSNQPARGRAVPAMRAERTWMARRTRFGDEHILRIESRRDQLIARAVPAIEEPAAFGFAGAQPGHRRIRRGDFRNARKPSAQLIFREASFTKRFAHVALDLVAAGAD